jgi:hypothetical protein
VPPPTIAFLIGAGASHGAGDATPFRPPLGYDLFPRLEEAFPETWGSLTAEEQDAFSPTGAGFEDGMKLLWEAFDERAWHALRDLGFFFSRFRLRPRGGDSYSRLLIALNSLGLVQRSCAASLNYECVFEIACAQAGISVDHLGSGDPQSLRVAKPHGSCNFLAGLHNFRNVTIVASPAQPQLLSADVNVVPPDAVEACYRDGYTIPPVMSLYAPDKRTPVGFDIVNGMRDDWGRWAASARVIVSIGAHPYLADEHIWQPVVESDAKVLYIGGQRPDYDRLAVALGGRLEYLGHDFAPALEPLLSRLREIRDCDFLLGSP